MKRWLFFFLVLPALASAQTPFVTDSALSYLRTLSVAIGARPMGSPQERQAMEFALAKFREFRLDEAYLMKFTAANKINTNSGVVVGVHRGTTDSIIVIGAHIDSESPTCPGANDNGSGSASVIELARILSMEQHTSTIYFCLFGGEEEGLIGSNYFVNTFPKLRNVKLMLQIDMANGSNPLIPTIDHKNGNTPVWLVQAAYEECAKLGYSGLSYPTHFFTAMKLMPGGLGSDHEPFLALGIPAMDFTSDINDPIHTPQDDFTHFKPAGLKRSGDLIYSLVHRFDETVPEDKPSDYYLLQIGKRAFFVPLFLLWWFVLLSVLIAFPVLILVRKRRTETDRTQRRRIPALKLFCLAVLIQTCVWFSENIVGIIKGTRFPWMAHPDGYFILGFLAGIFGIVISLKMSPSLRLSRDPYRWFLRAVIFLFINIILFSLVSIHLALYPACALLFLSLALISRRPVFRVLFWILSPALMFCLFFFEGVVFFGRMTALQAALPMGINFFIHLFTILFFSYWSFPFLLGFAAIYFDSGVDLLLIQRWKSRTAFILASGGFVLWIFILSLFPSYSDSWRPVITIKQSVNMGTGKVVVELNSNEYLRHLTVRSGGTDTSISTWERTLPIKRFTYRGEPWVTLQRTISSSEDSAGRYDIHTTLHFKQRPRNFKLTYTSKHFMTEGHAGMYITQNDDHSVSVQWKSFPDTLLEIPVHFKTDKDDIITETFEADFIELIDPTQIFNTSANIKPLTHFKNEVRLFPEDSEEEKEGEEE